VAEAPTAVEDEELGAAADGGAGPEVPLGESSHDVVAGIEGEASPGRAADDLVELDGEESFQPEPEGPSWLERDQVFVAEDVVDVAPPPLGDRDWHEAHTGEVLPESWQPGEGDAAAPGEAAEPAPPAAAAVAEIDRERAPRPTMITLGDGDPFGDVVDDEPTPVRKEIEPHVVMAPPSLDSLVLAGDNQLHLRLHGTGAIAESGQVRALDIEVPVPGSWVGNRRVTLQLRLTLSPVPEDDDGGPGGAP
jgi:hypothetical protein